LQKANEIKIVCTKVLQKKLKLTKSDGHRSRRPRKIFIKTRAKKSSAKNFKKE